MISSVRWSEEQLELARLRSMELFRVSKMKEPLEDYLAAFELYRCAVDSLLTTTGHLLRLDEAALSILTDARLFKAFRCLTGPPISHDDLRTLGAAVLSPARLRKDPEMVKRVIDSVRSGLDRRRFPWAIENREPSITEKSAAVLASAALMASSHVGTSRRSEGKTSQELQVETAFLAGDLRKVHTRAIDTLKRLNNDAAAKAEAWLKDFGTAQIVPVAVLSGVYKLHNLADAQRRGLTLFWAHDLNRMLDWIRSTQR